eukprot:m.83626 g.83626  ORF g.83626 m.83626 type:complete len:115 (+) comp9550_c0_seq3:181-525(+)
MFRGLQVSAAWASRLAVPHPGACAAVVAQQGLRTSAPTSAGQKHRIGQGKARSGTEYGPLTDLPDWSYEDGTPAPPTAAQLKRERQQAALQERIARLTAEMEVAVQRPRKGDDA